MPNNIGEGDYISMGVVYKRAHIKHELVYKCLYMPCDCSQHGHNTQMKLESRFEEKTQDRQHTAQVKKLCFCPNHDIILLRPHLSEHWHPHAPTFQCFHTNHFCPSRQCTLVVFFGHKCRGALHSYLDSCRSTTKTKSTL